jgi:hypothetical protein
MRRFKFGSHGVLVAFAMRLSLLACSLSLGSCVTDVCIADCEVKDRVAECTVTREECTTGFLSASECSTPRVPVTFAATSCFASTNPDGERFACSKHCNQPQNNNPHAPQLNTIPTRLWDTASGSEFCTAQQISVRPSLPGECARANVPNNGETASMLCQRGGRECTATAVQAGVTICTARAALTAESGTKCFNPQTSMAEVSCSENYMTASGGQLQIPHVHVSNVTLNDTVNCPPTAASGPATSYGMNVGPLGTAVHGSDIFALNATGGFLTFAGSCDSSGEFCLFSALRDMRVTLSDVVVAGVPVTNIEARLPRPAPIVVSGGVRKIPKANFRLEVTGSFLGGTSRVTVYPASDIILGVSGQTASFSFSSTFSGAVAGLDGVPVTVTVNVSASVNNPGAACAGLSPIQVLMGFEDLGWTSTQAQLSLSPSLHTQGCYALNVAGSGYMVVNSAPFATPLTGVTSTLKLDVYVPPAQPNPFWFGAVQLYASCPSAGMNNAYLGQAELTGKPTGAFSTVSYSVPSNVRTTLLGSTNGCFFSVAVNVNATPTPVVLDNLRFTP